MTESHDDRYERLVVPALAAPFFDVVTAPLADAPSGPFLDVACGTGATARALAARYPDRWVVVSDVDHRAVRYARTQSAGHSWLDSSADALALRDSSIAGVVCQQGAQFVPDAVHACRELARTTMRGAVIVVLCWTADGAPLFSLLDDALARTGAASTPQYARPVSFDLDRWLDAAALAGLATDSVEDVAARLRVDDARALVEHFIEPTDERRRTAANIATSTLAGALERGLTLTAVRVIHRSPRA